MSLNTLTLESETRAALDAVRAAVAPHGVSDVGVCRLSELSLLVPCRAKSLLPERGAVIAMLLPYHAPDTGARNVARYAVCRDYHTASAAVLETARVAIARLWPDVSTLTFCDGSPIPEAEAACRCGLGVIGRNGLLAAPRWGSRCFIAELVLDRELAPGVPMRGCPDCGRCFDACPSGALSREGFCRERCRSHITQKKGALTGWEAEQIRLGGLAWGCDLCADACPLNNNVETTPIAALRDNREPVLSAGRVSELAACMSYGWRGEAVLRRNLELLDAEK